MKYVKLIANADTWFKEGTEVLWEDSRYINVRPTEIQWEVLKSEGSGLFRGIREDEDGEVWIDGELCDVEEFIEELTDTPKELTRPTIEDLNYE